LSGPIVQDVIAFMLLCLVSAFRGAGGPQALTMFHLIATNPVLHRTTATKVSHSVTSILFYYIVVCQGVTVRKCEGLPVPET
jgi:hypothetical protein